MLRDIKAAYKSWSSIIAMLFSAITLFNYVTRALDLGISKYLNQIVAAYQTLFHPIIDFMLSPFHVDLLDWQKDLVLVWFAIGGAISRTFWSEWAMNRKIAEDPDTIRRSDYWDALHWALVSVVAWPVSVFFLFLRPFFYVHTRRDGRPLFIGRWHVDPTRDGGVTGSSESTSQDHKIIADMRVVMLVQLVSVALVVAALSIANAITA